MFDVRLRNLHKLNYYLVYLTLIIYEKYVWGIGYSFRVWDWMKEDVDNVENRRKAGTC